MSQTRKFEPLLPKTDIDLSNYEDALDYAMSNDEIRNIALSGSYGSGKSSVIRSYENRHKEKRFLHISLAHFKEGYKEQNEGKSGLPEGESKDLTRSPDAKVESITNLLEGKIVNQLLHQIDPKKVRQSGFHVKEDGTRRRSACIAGFATLFALLLTFSIRFEALRSFAGTLPEKPLFIRWMTDPIACVVAIALCFLMGGAACYGVLESRGILRSFKKIDLKGIVGIEVFEDAADSCFDKYLNEVLYLFEHSGADAVVFEDLDRYEVTRIFEKLKEISDLLYLRKQKLAVNDQKRSKRSSPKFFYLIRDDVFDSAERSKFFDFIIPVVPVIATGNAYDLLRERISRMETQGELDQQLLRTASLYLSDLRLINNIVNEYEVYCGSLGKTDLQRDLNCQLAIIIYKNLFPRDFERLQRGSGYVFSLLAKKEQLLRERREELEREREELRERLEQARREPLQGIDELNALFLPRCNHVYAIDGTVVRQDLSRLELVRQILSAGSLSCRNPNGSSFTVAVDDLRKEMEENPEYQRRKQRIEDAEEDRRERLHTEIRDIENEWQLLSTQKLRELLTEEESFWLPEESFADVTANEAFGLLQYLIRGGYIDEDYSIYISFFYPNSLTVRDKNFLLAVTGGKKPDYAYMLDSPERVLEWLDNSYFSREEIGNYALFDYLLEKRKQSLLEMWLKALDSWCDTSAAAFAFPAALWRETPHRNYLVGIINATVPAWFEKWTEQGDLLSEAEWQQYAVETLLNSPAKTLRQMNRQGWLAGEISKRKAFVRIDRPDVDKLLAALKVLKVRFLELDYREEDLPLVTRVYEEDLYELNCAMLGLWLSAFYGAPRGLPLENSYTYLLRKPEEALSRRVESHFEDYMDIILGQAECRFTDEPQAVIALLNHEGLGEERAEGYIQRLGTKLETLEPVEKKALWPVLLDNDAVLASNSNLLDYYREFCAGEKPLDEHFLQALQRNCSGITWKWKEIVARIETAEASVLYRKLIRCTELTVDQYRAVLKPIGAHYNVFEIRELPDEYMTVVIELGIIAATEKNLAFMRSVYPDLLTCFLMQDGGTGTAELVEQAEIDLTAEELRSMLESDRLQDETAMRLLAAYDQPLSIAGLRCSDAVRVKVLETLFDPGDINWFLLRYDGLPAAVQQAFLAAIQSHTGELYTAAKDEETIPVPVYAHMTRALSAAQMQELRQYLPNGDFELVCTTNQKPRFPGTEEAKTILDYFRTQGWISSYQKLGSGEYRAFSRQKRAAPV